MNIMQNIINAICMFFQNICTMFLAWIISLADLDSFSPDMTFFKETILSGNYNILNRLFTIGGLTIAILLLAFNILMQLFGFIIEQKDNIVTIFLRFFVVCFFSLTATTIFSAILIVGNNMWDLVVEQVGSGTFGDNGNLNKDDESYKIFSDAYSAEESSSKEKSKDDKLVSKESIERVIGTTAAKNALNNALWPLQCFIRAVLFGICAYFFLKLLIELVRRYVTSGILFMGVNSAVGLLGSAATTTVFFSYMRMFAVEIAILVISRLWVSLSLFMMSNMTTTVINFFIIIAFINYGVKLEGFFRDIGLSVSSTGPALLDSAATAGVAMVMMGARAKNAVGNGLLNVGGATGNMGLAAVGSAMTGKGLSPESVINAAHNSTGGSMREKFQRRAEEKGKSTDSNLTNSQKESMFNALRAGTRLGNEAFKQGMGSLNAAGKEEMLNAVGKSQFDSIGKALDKNGEGINMSVDSFDQYAGFGVSMKDKDGNTIATGTISDKAQLHGKSIGFKDANGNQKFLNLDDPRSAAAMAKGVSPLKEGETMSVGKSGGNGLSMAELRTGVNLSTFTSNGYNASDLELTGTADGGFDIYSGVSDGSDGKLIAHQMKDGSMAYTTDRWSSPTITDSDGSSYSREQDFANQFDGRNAFSNMGYNDVHDVKFNNLGTSAQFSYYDDSGNEKRVQFDQLAHNVSSSNITPGKQTIINGGNTYGTWTARSINTQGKK